MRSRHRRWGLAAIALIVTVVVALALRQGEPAAPVAPSSGHQHGAPPDPLTSAVLVLNVMVLLGLAVLARSWPAGVRRPGDTRRKWRYSEQAQDAPADDRPADEEHASTDPSTRSDRR
ncbi:hypothetical protein [Micromonospora craniellae]|uniref:Uncharacterized protein n=1 Tax=Micromonospora craniellae TaxID=2294034 RepID=A0A372FSL7_9ACTN|nr:hypothetical protein [Micromonospora craniellae]QOC91758.1 hypothetical protein ID554_28175 [Micromonospora craniellae]RFS43777.1 hypothetical protein D0Q02_25925 [Micromonospora craniellae]